MLEPSSLLREGVQQPSLTCMLLAAVALGCQSDPSSLPGDAGELASPSYGLGSVTSEVEDIVTLDRALLDLGRDMPGGFGGVYRGADGTVVVWLQDDSKQESAKDFLMARQNPDVRPSSRILRQQVHIRSAQYTWQELYDWYESIDAVIGHPGFVRSDMEERRNVIEIEMESDIAKGEAETILQTLGVPPSAVDVSVGVRATSLAKLSDRIRDTIPGGYKAVSQFATLGCTIGANVWNASGFGHGFVTASHCTDTFMGLDSSSRDDWWQNTNSGSNLVGQEEKDANTVDSSAISQCPTTPPGIRCRYSDAAIVQYNDTTLNNRGYIERTLAGSTTVNTGASDWKIVGTDSSCPWPNICTLDHVNLEFVGMVSGWRSGVRDTLNLCTIDSPARDNTKRLVCQFWVTAGGAEGDSGAPVFEIDNDPDVILYGVLWGGLPGKIVYSRIAWASSELGGFTTIAPPVVA